MPAPRPQVRQARAGPVPAPPDPGTLSARWRAALDAAECALRADGAYLSEAEVRDRRVGLAAERAGALSLLQRLARDQGRSARFVHLTPAWAARSVLALRPGEAACVFDLEGVLAGSAAVHAAAWRETLDEFVSAWAESTGARIPHFDLRTDYPAHIDGRSRLEGVREFLASRGIRLPEGASDDRPGAHTVHGLAARKNAALLRRLDQQGVAAFEGARAYLELAREAGIRTAVTSASANTDTILSRAGLTSLIDASVDGNTIAARQLRPRPAPDMLLEACRQLGVEPQRAAAFDTSAAGAAAARAAGFDLVVVVDRGGRGRTPAGESADAIVAGLDEILDRKLAA